MALRISTPLRIFSFLPNFFLNSSFLKSLRICVSLLICTFFQHVGVSKLDCILMKLFFGVCMLYFIKHFIRNQTHNKPMVERKIFTICDATGAFNPLVPSLLRNRWKMEACSKKNTSGYVWNWYRIGDMIKGSDFCGGCRRWPDTLGCAYLKMSNIENIGKVSIPILLNLVAKRITRPLSKVAMHLRVGDILTQHDCFHNACHIPPKPLNIVDFKRIHARLKSMNISSLKLFYNSKHCTRNRCPPGINEAYISNVLHFLKIHNYSVSVEGNGHPDDDFVQMAYSQVFIRSNGGYSRLISDLVKARGNIVI